jgi:hypothetical protein
MRIALVAVALVILVGAPFAASRGKLRSRAAAALAGGIPALLLWRANMPPHWFDGGWWGFLIAVVLMCWAFAGRSEGEQRFRLPFLFTFGAVLFALNLWAHV